MSIKNLLIICLCICSVLTINTNVYAQEITKEEQVETKNDDKTLKVTRSNIFAIEHEYSDLVDKYAEEKDNINYIDDRICISIGNKLNANIGDYIYLTLESNRKVQCIVCDIDTNIDGPLNCIYSSSSKSFVSLSDINSDWTDNIKEITVLDENYFTVLNESAAEYAQQFIGNPYVWGGTSLTDGADCSGFVMSIFSKFGIDDLPHNAELQANYGIDIDVDNIQPGDLLFYNDDSGTIGHVAIYIGDGQIVHASNSAPYPEGGIKVSQYNYRDIACIRRLF